MFEMSDRPVGRDKTVVPMDDDVASGADPVTLTLVCYRTGIHTGGTQGTEVVALPSGEYVGQRKLVTLDVLTDGSDDVSFTMTNIEENLYAGGGGGGAASALVLDAEGEYAMFEWSGAKWNLLYTNGTLTT